MRGRLVALFAVGLSCAPACLLFDVEGAACQSNVNCPVGQFCCQGTCKKQCVLPGDSFSTGDSSSPAGDPVGDSAVGDSVPGPTLVEIGSVVDGGNASSVYVVGQYAYVADMNDGLEIIDISDPSKPVEVGQLDTIGQTFDVVVVGGHAFVTGRDGFHVVDVSDPTKPTAVFQNNPSSLEGAVVVSGIHAYVTRDGAGLDIYDISDPIAPVVVGNFSTTSSYATDVVVIGTRAFLAYGQYGFVIADVSDPTAPTEVVGSRVDNNYLLYGVDVVGDTAYVTDRNLGLIVIDITDPASPIVMGSHDDGDWGIMVKVIGPCAYMANDWGGVEVVDVSDPADPIEIIDYADGGRTNHLFVAAPYIYVADDTDGLEILEAHIAACD